jgi:hypothetical protein
VIFYQEDAESQAPSEISTSDSAFDLVSLVASPRRKTVEQDEPLSVSIPASRIIDAPGSPIDDTLSHSPDSCIRVPPMWSTFKMKMNPNSIQSYNRLLQGLQLMVNAPAEAQASKTTRPLFKERGGTEIKNELKSLRRSCFSDPDLLSRKTFRRTAQAKILLSLPRTQSLSSLDLLPFPPELYPSGGICITTSKTSLDTTVKVEQKKEIPEAVEPTLPAKDEVRVPRKERKLANVQEAHNMWMRAFLRRAEDTGTGEFKEEHPRTLRRLPKAYKFALQQLIAADPSNSLGYVCMLQRILDPD